MSTNDHGSRPPPPADAPPAKATDPLEETRVALPPVDLVTALLIVGRNIVLPMSPRQERFSLGSASCDLVVRSEAAGKRGREHVSAFHCRISRKGNRLWVVDERSTNGTLVDGRREPSFERAAGQSFRVGDVTLLALDESLRLLRNHLRWYLGLAAHAEVDRALEEIAKGEPILLISPPGSEPERLAEQIHRASARRERAFVAVEPPLATRPEQHAVLSHATGGTAFVDLARVPKPPAYFVRHLFGAQYPCRPIFSAPDRKAARKALDEHFDGMTTLVIPTLAQRADEVPDLFDILFREAGSSQKMSELGEDLARLKRTWRKHFREVREREPDLRAYLEHGQKLAEAARALGIPQNTLGDRLRALGIRGSGRATKA